MNLNLQSKLDAILSFFDKQSSQKNQDLVTSAEQNKAKEERAAFVVALKDTLKNGGMNYDEAILRVRASEFSVEDKNIILAQLGEFEATPIKTASLKTQEVEEMDQVQKEIQRIGSKLPAYAAWLEETLKKDGYYMGTDG